MYWTLGFLTTFVIGGMTGVLMAVPPADYVVHNSLFLIAHFHNMLIPGAVFGYFAGYAYWFPKAVGFRLDEKWGKRAFWFWLVGFYLAFAPLYILGFMGMPRRMEHYWNLAWQPYLIIAAGGTALILVGIVLQGVQLVVSIRDRHANRDLTGDPWNGRTLEWTTASPPAVYNFAAIPRVADIDALTYMKEAGRTSGPPDHFEDIPMPKNSPYGYLIGILSFLFGFAMVWYIWWLAIASILGILLFIILRSVDDDTETVISAAEVKHMEEVRYRRARPAIRPLPAGATTP
jgi:cytochrome o ubiquinol oxidase subunit I